MDLRGAKQPDGKLIQNMSDVTAYLLESAHLAIVPFYAFGTSHESPWFRLSVGTCKLEDVDASMIALESALAQLTY
jgi:aspartate aminotransferase